MAEEIFDGIQRCIDDESLYLSCAEFFNLLQDKGVDVTDKQRADIEEKLQKTKAKTFTRQILYDYRLYPQLYKLAHELYKIWFSAKDVHFNEFQRTSPQMCTRSACTSWSTGSTSIRPNILPA
jgi:hypothetical protein